MKFLFIQMTMGDDRAVLATYIAGRLAYQRPALPIAETRYLIPAVFVALDQRTTR